MLGHDVTDDLAGCHTSSVIHTSGAALRQGDGGAYVGFLGEEGEGRVRDAYPGSTWERLAEIKGRYDPTNLFRLNTEGRTRRPRGREDKSPPEPVRRSRR